jgi:hypothetical protein
VSACGEHHAATATSVGCIVRNDVILSQITSTAGTPSEGARVEAALTATGFDLTTRNAAVSIDAIYLALYLGGARCWVGVEDVVASSTGSKSITTPGFRPRTVGAVGTTIAAANTLSTANGRMSVGFASLLAQGACGYWARDNQATSETRSVASQTDLVCIPAVTNTLDWVANLTAMTATGFDINVSDAAGANRFTLFFAVEGQYDQGPVARRWRRQLGRR